MNRMPTAPGKPKRPRGRPRKVYGPDEVEPILHSECLALDICNVARAGLLAGPGVRSGRVDLVDLGRPIAGPWLEAEASVGSDSGELALADVRPQQIPLLKVETAVGPMWRLACPHCGRPSRKLFRPRIGPEKYRLMVALFGPAPFWCRGCHGIRYRRGGKRDLVSDAVRFLAALRRDQAEIAEMVQGQTWLVETAKWLDASRERDGLV
jgi:hypothetical protein